MNYAVKLLADIVDRKKLPPKVLVVHRFTQRMLTNHEQIKLDPRVQVVIDMDGFGAPWHKEERVQVLHRAASRCSTRGSSCSTRTTSR